MARLEAAIGWRLPGERRGTLDARVVALVARVAQAGSLAAAARAEGLPYRTAWALVAAAERSLGQRLLLLERGVGARPAPLGARLLAARAEAERLVSGARDVLDVPVGRAQSSAVRPGLRIAASHDLVLAQLRDAWARRYGIAIAFQGSEDAIERYLAGRADVVGFHGGAETGVHGSRGARLDPSRDTILPFVERTQGLILPRGNPSRVRSLADVAERGLRYVNRQPGSGTRLSIERLLARSRVDPASILGWTREEFTHAAVAATVASGAADAGFGIQAAASQLGLAFVPLLRERYAFAFRRDMRDDARVRAFRRLIASDAVARVVAPLPGYRRLAQKPSG